MKRPLLRGPVSARLIFAALITVAMFHAVAYFPLEAGEYVLGPGDVLEISVWGHNDLAALVTVRPDGKISFQLVGDIKVEGLTVSELRAGLASQLEEKVKNPNVTVILKQQRTVRVQVLGAVRNPGFYNLPIQATLIDAVAAAGGATPEGDSTAVMFKRRTDGETRTISVNLDKFLSGAQAEAPAGQASAEADVPEVSKKLERVEELNLEDLILREGDIIYIPRAIRVLVLGNVQSPGPCWLRSGSRLVDAIAAAGGITPDGDGTKVSFTRMTMDAPDAGMWVVNIEKILTAGDKQANRLLHEGDIVFVPEAVRQVLVVGEVKNPGVYAVRRETRLLDAIAMAGGPTERAALESVCIFNKGEILDAKQVPVGKDNLLFQGNANQNPSIRAGDIVYVPETKKIDWAKIFSFLSGLNIIKDLLFR